ncbi:hypothetical protein G7K_2046-t1 [Saitoella complicata NRRL Y-17804]|uniref:Uncharacterized protein n=1 Tax=Saitoella complicata (strain BCRC 22490 / CBS 7301 / JCM 7358 / NBRC 10748 / NRRL Y-17804) TaxID=698492 RepID=A0A0E9NEL2_SAICN|nr:hypothetical protein G7K_2046-t1 [Saitoella complicata NRRL Y-17804]
MHLILYTHTLLLLYSIAIAMTLAFPNALSKTSHRILFTSTPQHPSSSDSSPPVPDPDSTTPTSQYPPQSSVPAATVVVSTLGRRLLHSHPPWDSRSVQHQLYHYQQSSASKDSAQQTRPFHLREMGMIASAAKSDSDSVPRLREREAQQA